MGNAQEKEIFLPGAFIEMQVALPEYNSSICLDIWREFLNKNSSHYQQIIDYFNNRLTSFVDMCLNQTLLDEITTQPYILPWYSQLAWISVFTVMIIVAIIGNLMVMWIIVAHSRMRTVTNMFLLNLAISDFLLATGNAAFNFVFMLNSHWPFGSMFCVISNVVAILTVSSSVFTILAMSHDRFVAVIFPFRLPMSKRVAMTIILLVWSISSLFCVPSFLYATTVTYQYSADQRRTLCFLQWPDGRNGVSYLDHINLHWINGLPDLLLDDCNYLPISMLIYYRNILFLFILMHGFQIDNIIYYYIETNYTSNQHIRFNIVFLVVTYVVPMLCMTVTYTWIGFILWSSKAIGEDTNLQSQAVKSKKRAVHMLLAIVILFAVCWLPYHVYFLYTYYNKDILHTDYIQHVFLAIYWLAMSNSCYNPIVYYNMNARFRSYFQDVMFIHTKPTDLETCVNAQQSYNVAARTSIITTNKMVSYGMSFPKQKAGNIAETPV